MFLKRLFLKILLSVLIYQKNISYCLLKENNAPSEDWIKKFFYCCNEKGLAVISLPYPQEENSLNVDVNISLPISPIEWYNIIKYSVGYVGNNMHPIIVSIHNAVPFLVLIITDIPNWLQGKCVLNVVKFMIYVRSSIF